MIDRDDRKIGGNQLDNHRIFKIHRGDHHAVHAAVKAVLQVAALLVPDILVDERDVIASVLRLHPDAVQNGGEKLMREAAASAVHKENADVIASICFQHPCGGVGHITHLCGDTLNPLPRLKADVLLIVQRFAHSGNGNTAACRDIFE